MAMKTLLSLPRPPLDRTLREAHTARALFLLFFTTYRFRFWLDRLLSHFLARFKTLRALLFAQFKWWFERLRVQIFPITFHLRAFFFRPPWPETRYTRVCDFLSFITFLLLGLIILTHSLTPPSTSPPITFSISIFIRVKHTQRIISAQKRTSESSRCLHFTYPQLQSQSLGLREEKNIA